MTTHFTDADRVFLAAVGIDAGRISLTIAEPDGTVRRLQELGIPVTRENYLRLAFMGNPPEEPLDGEVEDMLPEELQQWNEDEEAEEN